MDDETPLYSSKSNDSLSIGGGNLLVSSLLPKHIAHSSLRRGLIVGGNGQLAQFVRPFIPIAEIKSFDLKEIKSADKFQPDRLARNIIAANIVADEKLPGNSKNINQIVFLALPESIFASAQSTAYGGRSKLFNLLGVSGAGRSQTLIIYCNSVHQNAATLLDAFSGPVIGLHLMFRPDSSLRMSEQTAVITRTVKKQNHHLQRHAEDIVHSVLAKMGIGKVVILSPSEHDWLMSDVQFLSHSLFLTLAHLFTGLRSLPKHPLLLAVRKVAARILQGQAHVYCGIARNNAVNGRLLTEWRNRLKNIPAGDVWTVTANVISSTEETAEDLAMRFKMKSRHSVSTPISRARRELLQIISECHTSSEIDLVDILPSLENYCQALNSEQSYHRFFTELAQSLDELP